MHPAARRLALTLACLVALAMSAAPARAGTPGDRRFLSAKDGIGVEAPPDWTLSTHTGYPSVLVLLLHPDGSRISVAVSETPASDARQLVELNRKGFEAQKLDILKVAPGPRDGMTVEARAATRGERILQVYLVRAIRRDARQAIVISLVARGEVIDSHRAAMDQVMTRLSLQPIQPPAAAQPKPASAGESASDKDRR
jgi:hypothetical protein